jgi:hypothetical protein
MILRKPYAFLIKHFRLIHLILSVLSIFVIYKITPIVSFFRSYVLNDYTATVSTSFASQLIPFFLYLIVFIIIIINIAIIYLFIYKKKPVKFYIFYLIYYMILFVLLFVWSSVISSLAKTVLEADVARIYQDVSILIYIPQYIYVIVCIVRTLGFDIKQFDFKKDITDIEIGESDNEEVELSVDIETYKTKRSLRRLFREFKYYIQENKLIVYIIAVVVMGLIVKSIFDGSTSAISNYSQREQFSYKSLNITINDSVITNVDEGGKVIEPNMYYILLNVTIENKTNKTINFDYNNLKIYYGLQYLNPSLDLGINFVDYGYPFSDVPIEKKSSKIYVFAYKIDKSLINKSFIVKMHTGIIEKKNVYYATSNNIKIKPLILSDKTIVGTYNLNDTITLTSTNLKTSSIVINDFIVSNKYMYTYNFCNNGNCSSYKDVIINKDSSKIFLVLTGNIKIDENCYFYLTSRNGSDFVNDFVSLEYTLNDETITTDVTDVTPNNYTNGYIVTAPIDLANASNIRLLVTIRNRQYIIVLK